MRNNLVELFRKARMRDNMPQDAKDRVKRVGTSRTGMNSLMEEWRQDPTWGAMTRSEREYIAKLEQEDMDTLWLLPKELFDDYPKSFADAIMERAKKTSRDDHTVWRPNPNFPDKAEYDVVAVKVLKSRQRTEKGNVNDSTLAVPVAVENAAQVGACVDHARALGQPIALHVPSTASRDAHDDNKREGSDQPRSGKKAKIADTLLDKEGALDDRLLRDWMRCLSADIEDGSIWSLKIKGKRGGTDISGYLISDVHKLTTIQASIREMLQKNETPEQISTLACSEATKSAIKGLHDDVALAMRILNGDKGKTKS
jgi:hypothetical protein